MEKAITRAREGGYILAGYSKVHSSTYLVDEMQYRVFLDPQFWLRLTAEKSHHIMRLNPVKAMAVWHAFIDCLSNEGNPDEFFTTLLSKS